MALPDAVARTEAVGVPVAVRVAVAVAVGVRVPVAVRVAVTVGVKVRVKVGVREGDRVRLAVALRVAVGAGELVLVGVAGGAMRTTISRVAPSIFELSRRRAATTVSPPGNDQPESTSAQNWTVLVGSTVA